MTRQTISRIKEQITSGNKTAVCIVNEYIDKINNCESNINAFISLNIENSIKAAENIDLKIYNGEKVGLLAGIPIAVKDNISTKNIKTTCASKILSNYLPQYNATVVDRLLKEDAIIIGKTNLDEFAMGSTTESSYYGITKNPLDDSRVPGGSSGGSAAAVAAGFCVASLGSDTGGSIRQPAAYCGIYGLKPTYGAVSRYGLIAFASSLDQIGPMANSIEDLELIMSVISGHDENDSTSVSNDFRINKPYRNINELKIGIPKEYLTEVVSKDIKKSIHQIKDILINAGASVEECSLANIHNSIPTYYLIATAEASSNLARYDGVRYGLRENENDLIEMFKKTRSNGFGSEVKRRIMLGTYALSTGYYDAYYLKALKVRRLIQESFLTLFNQYDFLITPSTVQTAPKIGENLNAVQLYQQDICTCPINLAGLPALSMPWGVSNNLPIGVQIIGSLWSDYQLLNFAKQLDNLKKEL